MTQSKDVAEFGKYEGCREPEYEGLTTKSFYLTMGDGVKLAVDLVLPNNLPADAKIPTLLYQTRYWRAQEIRAPFKWFQKKPAPFPLFFTSYGYALVFVDVRGTGASFGTCRILGRKKKSWTEEKSLIGLFLSLGRMVRLEQSVFRTLVQQLNSSQ